MRQFQQALARMGRLQGGCRKAGRWLLWLVLPLVLVHGSCSRRPAAPHRGAGETQHTQAKAAKKVRTKPARLSWVLLEPGLGEGDTVGLVDVRHQRHGTSSTGSIQKQGSGEPDRERLGCELSSQAEALPRFDRGRCVSRDGKIVKAGSYSDWAFWEDLVSGPELHEVPDDLAPIVIHPRQGESRNAPLLSPIGQTAVNVFQGYDAETALLYILLFRSAPTSPSPSHASAKNLKLFRIRTDASRSCAEQDQGLVESVARFLEIDERTLVRFLTRGRHARFGTGTARTLCDFLRSSLWLPDWPAEEDLFRHRRDLISHRKVYAGAALKPSSALSQAQFIRDYVEPYWAALTQKKRAQKKRAPDQKPAVRTVSGKSPVPVGPHASSIWSDPKQRLVALPAAALLVVLVIVLLIVLWRRSERFHRIVKGTGAFPRKVLSKLTANSGPMASPEERIEKKLNQILDLLRRNGAEITDLKSLLEYCRNTKIKIKPSTEAWLGFALTVEQGVRDTPLLGIDRGGIEEEENELNRLLKELANTAAAEQEASHESVGNPTGNVAKKLERFLFFRSGPPSSRLRWLVQHLVQSERRSAALDASLKTAKRELSDLVAFYLGKEDVGEEAVRKRMAQVLKTVETTDFDAIAYLRVTSELARMLHARVSRAVERKEQTVGVRKTVAGLTFGQSNQDTPGKLDDLVGFIEGIPLEGIPQGTSAKNDPARHPADDVARHSADTVRDELRKHCTRIWPSFSELLRFSELVRCVLSELRQVEDVEGMQLDCSNDEWAAIVGEYVLIRDLTRTLVECAGIHPHQLVLFAPRLESTPEPAATPDMSPVFDGDEAAWLRNALKGLREKNLARFEDSIVDVVDGDEAAWVQSALERLRKRNLARFGDSIVDVYKWGYDLRCGNGTPAKGKGQPSMVYLYDYRYEGDNAPGEDEGGLPTNGSLSSPDDDPDSRSRGGSEHG